MKDAIITILVFIIFVAYTVCASNHKLRRRIKLWKDFISCMSQDGRILDKDDKPIHITDVNMTEDITDRRNLERDLYDIYNDKSYFIRISDGHFSIERKIEIKVKIEDMEAPQSYC